MASALIVFSHLRWDFVFQRPQHLLSRLAAHYPVVFVEEPVHHESQTFFRTYSPAPNVLVCQPHTPVDMPGFHDDHLPHLQQLMRQLVRDYDDHIAWFYTPMALPLLQELQPKLVVYDCMDALASFRNAPKQLLQRESALLKVADVVFTGGQSLYRAKRDRHHNVHCFPSSVDAAHFEKALDRANSHPAHRNIPGPRMGFYGVIDERFDTELIGKVADAHPQWQIVLVGPVVKIDPATLPQRANIHYLGQQQYDALPQFLAGWDVCLLPFALNEATRYISPTKTLEYMAAELPIVSTPVTDVADVYSDIVAIAGDAKSFVAACEAALLAPPEEHAAKVAKMRKVLASTSWDSTAEKMRALIEAAPRREVAGVPVAPVADSAELNRLPQHGTTRFTRTAIIGAGAAGLSAAYHLGADAVLLDRNEAVGGSCRSVREKGFTFDHTGQFLCSGEPYLLELYGMLLGENLHWQDGAAQGAALPRNTRFGYPLRGGFQSVMSAFVPHIKGAIELNADVIHISPSQRIVALADGRRFEYEQLVCTIPLPELVRVVGEEAPEEVRRAAKGLRHMSMRRVNLGIVRERISDKQWIHCPEGAIFDRIFVQGNASPACNPPGGFGITCEIDYAPASQPLRASGQALIDRCITDCIKVGLLRPEDTVIVASEVDLPYGHVVHDQERAQHVTLIQGWLAQHGIVLAGQFGQWERCDANGAILAGKRAAEAVQWMAPEKSAVAVE